MEIRPATDADRDTLWRALEPAIRAGESYALPRTLGRDAALAWWFAPGSEVLVAEDHGEMVGSSYVRANQLGPGGHVANGGYVVGPWAGGRGVARRMCLHSLDHARSRGFHAMQFNYVVSTNERAVAAWLACGFEVVGRVPGAFHHPDGRYVDVLVMHRAL